MATIRKRILIIEDNDALRKALAEHLAREGYVVDTAAEGSEGLTKLSAFTPDLIILDLSMPVVSGMGFLAAVEKTQLALPKVIVLTNDEQLLTVSEVLEHGISDYLVKAATPLTRIAELVHERLMEA